MYILFSWLQNRTTVFLESELRVVNFCTVYNGVSFQNFIHKGEIVQIKHSKPRVFHMRGIQLHSETRLSKWQPCQNKGKCCNANGQSFGLRNEPAKNVSFFWLLRVRHNWKTIGTNTNPLKIDDENRIEMVWKRNNKAWAKAHFEINLPSLILCLMSIFPLGFGQRLDFSLTPVRV